MFNVKNKRIEDLITAIKKEHVHLDIRCRHQIYDFFESVLNQDHRIIFLERMLSYMAYDVGSNGGGFHCQAVKHRHITLANVGLLFSDLNCDEKIKFNFSKYWKMKEGLGYPKCPWYDHERFTHTSYRLIPYHRKFDQLVFC